MKVIDLTDEYRELYQICLEDWSDQMKEAGNHKACWYDKMKGKGLGVKLALDDNDNVGGMIQYVPIEYSNAIGENLYFIHCIWAHGYKEGRGNFQKKGMGKALLQAAEEDVKNRGAKGLAAWGIPFPFWMKASWYKKQGYVKVDQDGFLGAVLLWKKFADDAVPPKWIKQKKKPEKIPGKVSVTAFVNGCCVIQSILIERAKRAAAEFGDKVVFREINTFDRNVLLEWGVTDDLYVDDIKLTTGPPPSYEKILKIIAKQVKKL